MIKRLVINLFFAFLVLQSFGNVLPDTTRNIFEKGLDKIKLQKARHFFMTRSYTASLAIYEELKNVDPTNPLINFRMGECNLEMKKYDVAVTYLTNSVDKIENEQREVHFYLGRAYHRLEKFDLAQTHFQKFKSSLTDKYSDKYYHEEIDRHMSQLAIAKTAQNKPSDVVIKNMGDRINTKFDDYGPAISSDGKTLIFSSRRTVDQNMATDPNDGKFMEDIYTSSWDSINKVWLASEPIKGRINTDDHDGCLSLSPDGQELYIYRNEGDAGNGAGDIFVSHASSSGKWSAAKELPKSIINTTYFESSASVTADNSKLYFISERKGGLGNGDIWMSEKVSKSEWGEPVNLGVILNTREDERMVFIHPEGNLMFFSSDGPGSMGGYDIFMSHFENGNWTEPVNMGYPINSVNDEINFTITRDGKNAYTSAIKPGGLGELDIYEIDLSKLDLVKMTEQTAIRKAKISGKISDVSGAALAGCAIEFIDVASNKKLGTVTTTDNGMYEFEVAINSSYRFVAKKQGYISIESAEIKIDKAEEVVKNLTLLQ